jgi:hypothetical protein
MAVLSARSIEYNCFTPLFLADSIIFVNMVPNFFDCHSSATVTAIWFWCIWGFLVEELSLSDR